MAQRVPPNNEYWAHDFAVWLRAMVAQWLGRNGQYGNAMVPLLIGAQGDGKSTFCRLLLPEELRDYYTDRIDFANRNSAEQMLTRFCLINIDEYDSLSNRQSAFLKHILQKSDIKMRKLYDSQVQCRQRYATFIGTTNDPTPLTDTTGSRRFLCIRTTGVIDTHSPIDYQQLYAQILYEVRQGQPTHFSKAEEQRIQRQNAAFQQFDVLEEVFFENYHLPQNDDELKFLPAVKILERMHQFSSGIRIDMSAVQRLSKMLIKSGFKRRHTRTQNEFGVAESVKV
jgi:predicted P-loop ATPase